MKTHLSILLLAVSTAAGSAADQTWTGAADALWNNTGNWSGGALPAAADLAVFDVSSTQNLATQLGADFSIRGLRIADVLGAVSIAAGNTLATGASGIDMSVATAGLSLSNPAILAADQIWNTGALILTTTATATISGTGILTKTGAGTLVLAGTNTFTNPLNLNEGQLTVKNGAGAGANINTVTNAGNGTVNLANGTTFRYERTPANVTVFPSTFLAVAPGSTAFLTTDNAGNGFGGSVSGAADSVLQIGRQGFLVQCSLNPSNLQQFANFNGTVRIFDAASLRFSPTSGLNNGGANASFEVNGSVNSRNAGTVTMGSLSGSALGFISASTNGGTVTYTVGQKNLNTTFAGTLANAGNGGVNILNFTKTGTGTQILTGNSTHTGLTTISGGVLQLGDGGAAGGLGTGGINLSDPSAILRVNRTGTLALAGIISGSGSLEKIGSSTLTLNAANSFAGAVRLAGGVVETAGLGLAGAPGGLGTGAMLVLDGGTLRYTGAATMTDRAITFGGGGATLDASGTGEIAFSSTAAPVFTTANAPVLLTLTGASAALNSFTTPLADNGTGVVSLTKSGAGTWQLSSGATFTGPVAVMAGTLILSNTSGSATGVGAVSVTGTLAGNGIAGGSVSVGNGGIISPGVNGIGNLTVGSLGLAAGSELSLGVASPASMDTITVTAANGLTINGGGVRLRANGTANPYSSPGTYKLIAYTGTLAGTPANLNILNPVGGFTYTFGAAGGFVTLTIASAGLPNSWNTDTSSAWSTASNWTTGVPGGIGSTVNFLGVITAPRSVTLDSPRTAGTLRFDNSNPYTIDGASLLSLNNGTARAAIFVDSGNHIITAPVDLATAGLLTAPGLDTSVTLNGVVSGSGLLTQNGVGKLVLGGTNSWTGGTAIQTGTLEINTASNLGSGALAWTGSGILRLTGNTTLAANLSLAAGVTGTIDTTNIDATLSGAITGSGILAKNGGGVISLTGANAWSGGLLVRGGLVSYTIPAQLGTGTITFDGGGVRFAAGNTDDLSLRTLTMAAGGGLIDTGANNVAFTAPIGNGGSGSFTKSGSGKLTFTVDNTYTGRTRVLGGSLGIAATDNLGPAPLLNVPNHLTLDAGLLSLDGPAFEFTATRGLAVGPLGGTVMVPAGALLTLRGGITNRDAAPGILNLEGGGAVTIAAISQFAGGGIFQALTVNANATDALGTGTIQLEGTILNCGNAVNLSNNFSVQSSAAINMSNTSPGTNLLGALTGTGVVTLSTPFVRGGIAGNWSGFGGDLNLTGNGECRITGGTGFDNARVNIMGITGLVLAINPPNSGTLTRDIKIGQLTGNGQLGGQPVPGRFVNWSIGFLGTDSTFEGIIRDGMSQTIGTGIGASGITKEGIGTLKLTGNSTYTGRTNVAAGTLLVNGDNTAAIGAITVTNGTLGGSGTMGGAVTVLAAGSLSPGAGIGPFTTGTMVLDGNLITEFDNANINRIDRLTVNGDLSLGATSHLVLTSAGLFPTSGALVIATYSGVLTGTFSMVTGLPSGYALNYAYNDGNSANNIAIIPSGFSSPAYNAWLTTNNLAGADALSSADPDKDGRINLLEFALDGNPNAANDDGKFRPAVIDLGGGQVLTLTVPVRTGAVFGGASSQTASVDGMTYTIEGSDDLASWGLIVVSEVIPAAGNGLPALNTGWTYHTFRTPGAVSADLRDYLRVKVAPAF